MIETQRLILRRWKESDHEPFSALNADSKVCKFFPNTLSKKESNALADKIEDRFNENGFGFYALEHKENGNFIGFCGLNKPSFKAHFTPCVEIGWRLSSAYWNKGYATEAARAALDEGFNHYDLKEIVSFTVPENIASRRVMEKIDLTRDDEGDFDHPALPDGHPLKHHVLYRKCV